MVADIMFGLTTALRRLSPLSKRLLVEVARSSIGVVGCPNCMRSVRICALQRPAVLSKHSLFPSFTVPRAISAVVAVHPEAPPCSSYLSRFGTPLGLCRQVCTRSSPPYASTQNMPSGIGHACITLRYLSARVRVPVPSVLRASAVRSPACSSTQIRTSRSAPLSIRSVSSDESLLGIFDQMGGACAVIAILAACASLASGQHTCAQRSRIILFIRMRLHAPLIPACILVMTRSRSGMWLSSPHSFRTRRRVAMPVMAAPIH